MSSWHSVIKFRFDGYRKSTPSFNGCAASWIWFSDDASTSTARMRREANTVLDVVAGRLRNTRAVCRSSYVHPAVLEAYADATLVERWRQAATRRPRGLTSEEQSLLGFLRTTESARTSTEAQAA